MKINSKFILGLLRAAEHANLLDKDHKGADLLVRKIKALHHSKEEFVDSILIKKLFKVCKKDIPIHLLAWELTKGLRLFDLGIIGYYLYSCPNINTIINDALSLDHLFSNTMKSEFSKNNNILKWTFKFPEIKSLSQETKFLFFLELLFRHKIISCILRKKIQPCKVGINYSSFSTNEIKFIKEKMYCSNFSMNENSCFLMYNVKDLASEIPSYNAPLYEKLSEIICSKLINKFVYINNYKDLMIQLINQEINNEQFSLEFIAKKLNTTPRNLQRKLKSENTSFSNLLKEQRAELSIHYLNKGYYNKTIAKKLGYADANSFYRAFKKWYDISPNEYISNNNIRNINNATSSLSNRAV